MEKIFGLGLPKTGTTSLLSALKTMGFNIGNYYKNYPITLFSVKNGNLVLNKKVMEKLDAAGDLPVVFFYKELDKLFPGSKFIMTHRKIDSWLLSCSKNIWTGKFLPGNHRINLIHEQFFGTKTYDENKFRKAYYAHIQDVRNYFRGRNDLLEINLEDDNKWDMISEFLKIDVPRRNFPKNNKGHYRILNTIKNKFN